MSFNWYSIGLTDLNLASGAPPSTAEPHLLSQGDGCLIVAQGLSRDILAASFNHRDYFSQELLGRRLTETFDRETCRWIETQCNHEAREQNLAYHPWTSHGQSHALTAHRRNGLWIIELLPFPEEKQASGAFARQLASQLQYLAEARSLKDAANRCARALLHLLSFERVFLYRLDQEGSGHILVAMARDGELPELEDTVIPANGVRHQPLPRISEPLVHHLQDTEAPPVPLVSFKSMPEHLNLRYAHLSPEVPSPLYRFHRHSCRSVTSATVTVNDRLWGAFVCQQTTHTRPLSIKEAHAIRTISDAFGRLVSTIESQNYIEKMEQIQDLAELFKQKCNPETSILDLIDDYAHTLMCLFESDGLQAQMNGRFHCVGTDYRLSENVLDRVRGKTREGLFIHDSLDYLLQDGSEQVPPGLIFIGLSSDYHDYLCLFRQEAPYPVKWVSLPEERTPPAVDLSGWSFWHEEVKGVARPYQVTHRDMAQLLRNTIMLATLREQGHIGPFHLRSQSHYDALTGLPNRLAFDVTLRQSLEEIEFRGTRMALLFVDLDNFKQVNDTLGHNCGDKLLVEVSHTLLDCVGSQDYVARLSGDEFTIILNASPSRERIQRVCERIATHLEKPFEFEEGRFSIGCSIGITVAPKDGIEASVLTRNADLAMYHAKWAGKNRYCFYEKEMRRRLKRRERLEEQLEHSLEDGKFLYHFQPIMDVDSNRMVGAEALLRWKKPRGTIQPASVFHDIAQEHGLINRIDAHMIRSLVGHLEVLKRQFPGTYLTCNLSEKAFLDGHIDDLITELEKQPDLMSTIMFELKESALMGETERAQEVLQRIQALRGRVVIDNFGTGTASLVCLNDFPISAIKIDRAFLENLDLEKVRRLLMSIIAITRNLGIDAIAEGVETPEQAAFLKAIGCHIHQGFLYGKPMAWEQVFTHFH
ncbi:EAL domain-containing protein [Marinobacteraceae bacterium S3BR75-40.1]